MPRPGIRMAVLDRIGSAQAKPKAGKSDTPSLSFIVDPRQRQSRIPWANGLGIRAKVQEQVVLLA